uniref:Uncharacterized protein n=1 Tax=Micrurus corallinus TaxID=54390 RepID=A0A2D4G4B1_MICCO
MTVKNSNSIIQFTPSSRRAQEADTEFPPVKSPSQGCAGRLPGEVLRLLLASPCHLPGREVPAEELGVMMLQSQPAPVLLLPPLVDVLAPGLPDLSHRPVLQAPRCPAGSRPLPLELCVEGLPLQPGMKLHAVCPPLKGLGLHPMVHLTPVPSLLPQSPREPQGAHLP